MAMVEMEGMDAERGSWLNRDPINENGLKVAVDVTSALNLDEERSLYGFVRNNAIGLYDRDGRIVPLAIGGGIAITTGQPVAAAFGLSLIACLANPECAEAIREALAREVEALGDMLDRCFSRRLVTCTVRCQVVQIGNENNVIGWAVGTGSGPNRPSACKAAEAAARNSTEPGTRTKHCFPR